MALGWCVSFNSALTKNSSFEVLRWELITFNAAECDTFLDIFVSVKVTGIQGNHMQTR